MSQCSIEFRDSIKNKRVFVPVQKTFKELEAEIAAKSSDEITKHLGYHPDQVFVYGDRLKLNADIYFVIVEVFTKNIVYVITRENIDNLSEEDVNRYLSGFNLKEVYHSSMVEEILEGSRKKSLKFNYLSKVLKIKQDEADGFIYIHFLDTYFYFNEGNLLSFFSIDSFNESCKFLKNNNHSLLFQFGRTARKKWGNDVSNAMKELNLQADHWKNNIEKQEVRIERPIITKFEDSKNIIIPANRNAEKEKDYTWIVYLLIGGFISFKGESVENTFLKFLLIAIGTIIFFRGIIKSKIFD